MKTFNYATFKQQWRARCAELRIDPVTGPTGYTVALVKAEAEIARKSELAGWWDAGTHGKPRDVGDMADEHSTWDADSLIHDPTLTDIPTLRELWIEVTKEIRKDVSPRNYERWQPIASQIGADLVPMI